MKHLAAFLFCGFVILNLSCSSIIRNSTQLALEPKTIVLTFDDGPNATFKTTENLLRVLKKHNVTAYFCLMGENMIANAEIVRKIVSEGHGLVNHGFTDHPIASRNEQEIQADIDKWESTLQSILGKDYQPARFFRPAYGMYGNSLIRVLHKNNLSLMPVSFYAFDAECGPRGQTKVIAATLDKIYKNKSAVIVLHDGKDSHLKLESELKKDSLSKYNRSWIPEAADSIITSLTGRGYRIGLFPDPPPR